MRPLRVLVLANIISPHRVSYLSMLAKSGVDVTAWFLSERSSTRHWEAKIPASVHAAILPGIAFEIQRQERDQYLLNPSILWRLPKGGFDVVAIGGWDSPTYWLATAICSCFGIPLVLWSGSTPGAALYGGNLHTKPKGLRRIARPLVRWHVRQASAYCAYGSRAQRYLEELGAPPCRIHKVWNTVDVDGLVARSTALRSRREAIRSRLGVESDQVMLLYVGRFQPFKNVETLITAYGLMVDSCPSLILGLVGYGPCEHELRAQAKALGKGDIRFFGHVSLDDMPEFYAAADVFVLPSGDIWGLVVNEAMACGLPVIAADSVGCTDDLVIPGITGFVFPSGSPTSLAQVARQLVVDKRLRLAMGSAAQDHVMKFTLNLAVEALSAALQQAFECRQRTD